MKLPESVKVGPYRYRVVCDQAAIDRARVVEHDTRLAESDHRLLTITIDSTVAPDQIIESLLHEVMHAMYYTSHCPDGKDGDEETVIKHLSPLLLDVLRSNPDLVACLTEKGINGRLDTKAPAIA